MSLSNVEMSQQQAEALARTINQSQSFQTKYVAREGGKPVVVAKNTETGYEVRIHNPEHWEALIAQIGGAGTLDEFGNAGAKALAHLDEKLGKLRKERDAAAERTQKLQEQVEKIERQRWTIEQAVLAISGLPPEDSGLSAHIVTFPQIKLPPEPAARIVAQSGSIILSETSERPKNRPPGRPGSKRYPPLPGGLTVERWVVEQVKALSGPNGLPVRGKSIARGLARLRGVEPEGAEWAGLQATVASRLSYVIEKKQAPVERIKPGSYRWTGGEG